MRIQSGGQTGVDRAALDVAIELGIPVGGWCPKGRLAEDGTIPEIYPLIETPSADYRQRTLWNMRDSDATLILTFGPPSDGTQFTIECAQQLNKSYRIMNLDDEAHSDPVAKWLSENQVSILNIAGPRESFRPGVVYAQARSLLLSLLS